MVEKFSRILPSRDTLPSPPSPLPPFSSVHHLFVLRGRRGPKNGGRRSAEVRRSEWKGGGGAEGRWTAAEKGATRVACVRRTFLRPFLPRLPRSWRIDRPVRVRERVTEGGTGYRNLCVVLGVVRARVHADATLRDARQRECPSQMDLTIVERCWFNE